MDRERLARALINMAEVCGGAGMIDNDINRCWIDAGLFNGIAMIDAILADIAEQGFVIVPGEARK